MCADREVGKLKTLPGQDMVQHGGQGTTHSGISIFCDYMISSGNWIIVRKKLRSKYPFKQAGT